MNNALKQSLSPVHHGLAMGLLALILGAMWAGYMATHHEALHGNFEQEDAKARQSQAMMDMGMESMSLSDTVLQHTAETANKHTHNNAAADGHHEEKGAHGHAAGNARQHSHSGSLPNDAMQRLLRGHIHFMGIGLLAIIVLIVVASTSLKQCWKRAFGWTFGLGALLYPPAWILMGLRTVQLGPEAAEASVLWLFGPAVALLLGSLIALFSVLLLECTGLRKHPLFSWAFDAP